VGAPFVHVHRVRFEEIDAAGIAYFGRFFTWCHDAMEAMLAPIDGGYVGLVRDRKMGLPAVHVDADFAAPLRYGDGVRVAVTVERIGTSSVALRFELSRLPDAEKIATVRHVVAHTDMAAMRSRPVPDDVRAILERHTA
jgi:4-hydroxybenzoyl-CoA thioesterase